MTKKEEFIPPVPVTPYLTLLCTAKVEIEAPLELGKAQYGVRRIINIKGGVFSGPKMSGRVLPGGADWQIIRNDGITEVEARYTLETHDGALIFITNRGLRHGPKEVMERLAAGEAVDPQEYYFRTVPFFETGAPAYKWLNGIVSVAVGQRLADEVILSFYEVM
ncbi:MAG: DUF3237 domain-containing protein [Pseudomonadota bacterium]